MTDNEIIKALECCMKICEDCDNCPCINNNDYTNVYDCKEALLKDALDLITHQKAEIERLKKDKYKLQKALNQSEDYRVVAKAEAYKEFAERLKDKSFETIRNYGLTKDVVEVCDIDNLVKEFEKKENTTYDD